MIFVFAAFIVNFAWMIWGLNESRILCHMFRKQRLREQSVPLGTTRSFESWIWINALSSGEHTVIMLSALTVFVFPDSLLLQDSSGKTFLPLTVCERDL